MGRDCLECEIKIDTDEIQREDSVSGQFAQDKNR